MLMGLAAFAAAAGAAVLTKETAPVSLGLTILAFAAWVTGACAAIGYVRWLFEQAKRDQERT